MLFLQHREASGLDVHADLQQVLHRMRLHDAERPLQLQRPLREDRLELGLGGLQARARMDGVARAVCAPRGPQRRWRALLADAGVRRPAHELELANRASALDAHRDHAWLLRHHADGASIVLGALVVLANHLRLRVLEHHLLLADDEEPGAGELGLQLLLQGHAVDRPLLDGVRLDDGERPLDGEGVEVREEELDVPHGVPLARAAVHVELPVHGLEVVLQQRQHLRGDVAVEVLEDQDLDEPSGEGPHVALPFRLRHGLEEAIGVFGLQVHLFFRLCVDVPVLE
mmetsp:Transcript_92806/g.266890  ORF Transcript_92806/g.266890 Transcript_92806/m.266890 type:complete len:285 (-) Transcript_92806:131-985(-)